MKLYIIRHGDPNYETDTLTERGIAEAKALADWFADKKLDKIYSSPSPRALETASYTCKATGLEAENLQWIGEHYDFMESSGLKNDHDCTYSFSVEKGIYDFNHFIKNEDKMSTIYNMVDGSDKFLASYGYVREGAMYRIAEHSDKNVAVFCHGGAGASWIGHLIGLAPALSFVPIVIETSSVTMFEFVKEDNEYIRPELRYLGALHHLYAAGIKEKIKY